MIEAGLEQQPGIESALSSEARFGLLDANLGSAFLHVLQLACKAGVSLSGRYMPFNVDPTHPDMKLFITFWNAVEAGQNDSAAAVLASAAKVYCSSWTADWELNDIVDSMKKLQEP